MAQSPTNEQAIANAYSILRSEMNQLYFKIAELEMEVSEHALVIGVIEPLDQGKRCYRMIEGVLVERTVGEVLPAVRCNKEGLEDVVARLNEALKKKKKEIADFELKHKIKVRREENKGKGVRLLRKGLLRACLSVPLLTNSEKKHIFDL